MKEIKVMSFNLKNNKTLPFRKTHYSKRVKYIVDIIKEANPDIIGCQEMSFQVRELLKSNLKEYHFFASPKIMKGKADYIANTILVKKDITVLESEIYSLGKDIKCLGSKNLLSLQPRSCNKLVIKIDDHMISIFNVHLDCLLQNTRNFQIQQLNKIIKLDQSDFKIITGDFNMIMKDSLLDFVHNNHLLHMNHNIRKSFLTCKQNGSIDHILVSSLFYKENCYCGDFSKYNVKPSDHYPIIGTLLFPSYKKV